MTNHWNSAFLWVHSWCFVSEIIAHLFRRKGQYEISKIFDISSIPFYIYYIYVAHYQELNSLVGYYTSCDDPTKVDLMVSWYELELRVFYGYILSGIAFLSFTQWLGIKTIKNAREDEDDNHNRDFLEKHYHQQVSFSLHTVEIIVTVIMLLEYYVFRQDDTSS